MRIPLWAATALLALSLAACGKSGDRATSGDADNAAARQAAADAANVTSIPGYTPQTGLAANAASANTSP